MSRSFTKSASLNALRLFVAAIVLFGLASAASAQESNDVARPLTKQGSGAFIFHLNGLGDFGLNGPVIANAITDSLGGNKTIPGVGFKYFPTDDIALRFLLAFKTFEFGKDDLASTNGKFQQNTSGGAIGAEYHFRPLYSTSPYIGAQVGFVTDNAKRTFNGKTVSNFKTTSFGVAALTGFDWFFTKGLAIGGEYSLGFTSSSIIIQNGVDAKQDEPTNTDVGLGGTGNVHLVVYF